MTQPAIPSRIHGAVRRLMAPPVFESEQLTQRARMFHRVMGWTMVLATTLLLIIGLTNTQLLARSFISMAVIDVMGLVLLAANRRGYSYQSSVALIAGLVVLITLMATTAGGVRSVGVSMYFIFVLMAATLLGERAAAITAIVCAS